jgi:hypothetical protein
MKSIGTYIQQLSIHCDAIVFVFAFFVSHFSEIIITNSLVSYNYQSKYVK